MEDKLAERLIDEINDLGETLKEAIGNLIKEKDDKEEDDKEEKPNAINESLQKLTETISKFKQIDLKPIGDIAKDISKQNASILDVLGRLIHSNDNSALINSVTEMVGRSMTFIERAEKKTDYSEHLKSISDKLGKDNPIIEKLVVKRQNGLVDTVDVVYKKISNGR